MTDKYCEELTFPVLFPKGEFRYTVECDVKLSPVKYFKTRLLDHSASFENKPEYLVLAQFIMEQKQASESINIALKKIHGQPLTASQVRSIDAPNLRNLIYQDQAYYFIFETNIRFPVLLATVYVWNNSYDKTTRNTNMVYNFILRRSQMPWALSDNIMPYNTGQEPY